MPRITFGRKKVSLVRRLSRPNRQAAHSEALVLDDHEGSVCEFCRTVVNDPKETRIDGGRRLIAQSKDDDARRLAARDCQNVSEVEIECEDGSAFRQSFRHDVGSGRRMRPSSMPARNLTRQGS